MTKAMNLLMMLVWYMITPAHAAAANTARTPQFFLPKTSLEADDLAVIVNDNDDLSRKIGEYYRVKRHIPERNMIHVRFQPGLSTMPREEFIRIKKEVDRKTPREAQAFALAWTIPYRVDCMSVTSAFTFGYNKDYCSHDCGATKPSPYYNSGSVAPYGDLKIRPAMALAGSSFAQVKALIDRGIAADNTQPGGTAYLLSTSDKLRNVRAVLYPHLLEVSKNFIEAKIVEDDYIRDKQDVLFYFTGLMEVPYLDTLQFRPGAMADHLTSLGGQLDGSSQMSSLRWLEAGATGSYGAVAEPCNHLAKFPDPGLAMYWYLAGSTLLEAYWKSVRWPGEGIFIGEPLAKPFGGHSVTQENGATVLRTRALPPGVYGLLGAESVVGPYRAEPVTVTVHPGSNALYFGHLDKPVYQIVRLR